IIDANHFAVPAGKLVASAYGFKPGYTYNLNDTAKSAFFFYSDMPNNGFKNGYAPYIPGDLNVSEVVINIGRYQEDPGQFNGLFMPTYSFVGGYQLEEHLVSYYVTGTFDAGVN